ncbi:hypothetical protein [Hydrogenophaga sp. IBVHS1]|jgi:hypothetical protein|uniref:hypothetical protein n=2 Tax=unclassified Hydrogenophaga TaxID=2610897 RepID=UPI000A322FAC|nr:hypothetical protein [Hydrogenophaga sp. IBVHS1]
MIPVHHTRTKRFPRYMSKTKKPARRRSSRRRTPPLLANGVGATAAGMALWLLSLVMEARGLPPVASKALLAPAWMAIGIGIALLVLHMLEKRRTQAEADMLLRQHSTFLEPMPRLKPRAKEQTRSHRSSSQGSLAGRG